jgi:hypothetical protein
MAAHVDPNVPQGYEPFQGFSRCLKSLRQLMESTLSVSDLAPHVHAPFHSTSLSVDCQAVVNINVADNAAANAGGILLHGVQNFFSPVAPAPQDVELVTAPAGSPAGLVVLPASCIYLSPPGYVTVIKSWGASVLNNVPNAVKISASISGGPNRVSSPPNPSISSAQADRHQPVMVIVPENKYLSFSVSNRDPGSAALVQIAWTGWRIPVRRYEQTLKSMLPNPGWGGDCV